jgi:hypothetical protein
MTLDVHRQCSVCAWRGACVKKHTIKETVLHCPEFCKDVTLKGESGSQGPSRRSKQIEDVFRK